ncbi:hypothetical protein P8452_42563 [Trifolium repens]|nr:hypothetical protein P8452_42563 [Trifolium repens]
MTKAIHIFRSSRSESQTGVDIDNKLNIPIPIPLGFLENNTKMRMMVLYHGEKGRSISLFLAILENLYILGVILSNGSGLESIRWFFL